MDKPFPAYEGDEPYLFVCYAHDDARLVYPEILWLREQGINIWYDEGITPGVEFPERLGQAILRARLLLFYISPRSAASRHCRDEVYFALDHAVSVLPCHVAPTQLPAGLALSTATTQGLMRYEMPQAEYRRKLLTSVRSRLAKPGEEATVGAVPAAPRLRSRLARLALPLGLLAFLAVAVFGGLQIMSHLDHQAEVRRVQQELLPEIRRMMDDHWRDYTEPYALALEAEQFIPGDPELAEIFAAIALYIDIDSEPPGATVYFKQYARPDDDWQPAGITPIRQLRVPVGIFRWKFEKEGYETVFAAASSWDLSLGGQDLLVASNLARTLDPLGSIPAGMVRIAGAQTPYGEVRDFFIDRYEVTNQEFERFIAAGGYADRGYWQHEFVEDGRVLGWEEAMNRFVDRTGRPGPATWFGGTWPESQENHPVSGVSWYEAAAYAEFVGRALPTGVHWGIARGEYSPLIQYPQFGGYAVFAPFSNFGSQGTVEVGSLAGLTAYGAYDMAGNVREWCANETDLGRLARGGAFSDNPYQFAGLSQAPPMLRDAGYGFRTALYPDQRREPEAAFAPVTVAPEKDFHAEPIVSDEVFEVLRRQFDYDPRELYARQESFDDSAASWTLERVSVDTAYGDERMIINLFLPKNVEPPYQAVIYVPGSTSLFQTSSERIEQYFEFPVFLSFLVRTGRAVVYPVYQGTFERSHPRLARLHLGEASHAYGEFLAQVVKDFRRTIDYLDTRADIDRERIAYYGMSWGGVLAGIIPAVETRPRTAIVLAGGLVDMGLREVNPIQYVSRVTMPVLMLVGRYDTVLNYEGSARPKFELLGTPDEHKAIKAYATDHIPPKSEYVAEILDWLDVYLGRVAPAGPTERR